MTRIKISIITIININETKKVFEDEVALSDIETTTFQGKDLRVVLFDSERVLIFKTVSKSLTSVEYIM